MSRKAVLVVICGALVVTISMGVRQAFGIFLQPISAELGTGREIFSLAIATQNLILGLPLMAIVADRFGSRWVVLGGGLLYAVGLLLVTTAGSSTGLYTTLGFIVGLALSSTTYTVVLGAVAQLVPPAKRSSAFGITTAAGSFGMFALVPAAQWLLSDLGWQTTFLVLAAVGGTITLLAFGFPNKPAELGPQLNKPLPSNSLPQVLRQAGRHSGYWLLNAGFFVCGFHVAFIATHLPAFLTDQRAGFSICGFQPTFITPYLPPFLAGGDVSPMTGATALALIGFANIFGSYLFGWLGDRYRKKILLSLLYLARAIVITLFLLLPITDTSALIFGGTIGFLWLATVPLTSGIVAEIFGIRYLSTLYGVVFLSHQIGSFLGVWLGGRIYDLTGSYNTVWLATILLGLLAAALHVPIAEQPVASLKASPVA